MLEFLLPATFLSLKRFDETAFHEMSRSRNHVEHAECIKLRQGTAVPNSHGKPHSNPHFCQLLGLVPFVHLIQFLVIHIHMSANETAQRHLMFTAAKGVKYDPYSSSGLSDRSCYKPKGTATAHSSSTRFLLPASSFILFTVSWVVPFTVRFIKSANLCARLTQHMTDYYGQQSPHHFTHGFS